MHKKEPCALFLHNLSYKKRAKLLNFQKNILLLRTISALLSILEHQLSAS